MGRHFIKGEFSVRPSLLQEGVYIYYTDISLNMGMCSLHKETHIGLCYEEHIT